MTDTKEEKECQRLTELSRYEAELIAKGYHLICGVDEAGRGPLAGPVCAAAVILPPGCRIPGINDSKKLSEKKRLQLEPEIKKLALAWACVFVNHNEIDRINILEASRLAMCRAIRKLNPQPDYLLTDAMELPLDIPQLPLIHGDAQSITIAAASIIAKNTRDRLMLLADKRWPQYGFAGHKGYPTAAHKSALQEYGPCPIHRRSFHY